VTEEQHGWNEDRASPGVQGGAMGKVATDAESSTASDEEAPWRGQHCDAWERREVAPTLRWLDEVARWHERLVRRTLPRSVTKTADVAMTWECSRRLGGDSACA
jgi:hypothetical protein